MNNQENVGEMLTFGGHLEVLRKMLFRIIIVTTVLSVLIFCFKQRTFELLLAPSESSFVTFHTIEKLLGKMGWDFHFAPYQVSLISTELAAQFMTHITTSLILGLLLASPYILFELFKFITPALYENERKYSALVAFIIYGLFILGLLMSYFVLFPISFQFLGNYQVNERITNTITLDSYISTFTTLTFLLGIVFQLPVIAFILGKMGLIDAGLLRRYRAYAFVIIMVVAAVITPPDLMTLILVTVPIYMLYEVSIMVLKRYGPEETEEEDNIEEEEILTEE